MFGKIKKRWIIFISILLLYLIFSLEYRKFYCLENGKCITVWYRNDVYYVIPYKYYGLFTPKEGYIEVYDKTEIDIDIYWVDSIPNEVFFAVSPLRDGLRQSINSKELILSNIYYSPEEYDARVLRGESSVMKEYYRNILYSQVNTQAMDVRKNVSYIFVNVAENSITGKKVCNLTSR